MMLICKNCGGYIPSRVNVDGKIKKLNGRRYCLSCSPFKGKKFNYETDRDENRNFHCRLCGQNTGPRRRMCNICVSRIRRFRAKRTAVKWLGGKCNRCGWVGDIAAFEFHHPGDNKEFDIGTVSNRAWATIVKELKKCELLCSNCHRTEHHGIRDENFLKIADEYGGKIYV